MDKGYSVQFTDSLQPFKDILIPATQRPGYIGGQTPIVPIYFYRQIGITGVDTTAQNTFYNELIQLDRTLSKQVAGYVRFDQTIVMPTNDESNQIIGLVARGTAKQNVNLKEKIVTRIKSSGTLRMFVSDTFNANILEAFDKTIEMYMVNEQHINESKAENFALKMLIWLYRYKDSLFKERVVTDTPKVLFYGDIKSHEMYFLHLLSFIGCDVLFVHTDKTKDQLFNRLLKTPSESKRLELSDSIQLEPFPQTERAIQKTTVAYNASKEIASTLYGADVGLFKAWQYEGGNTKSVMLKTTYDELKILWNEDAKIRPEFEVRDDRVYVPNIFAKVNGTQENLEAYWKDFHTLTHGKSALVFRSIPFTNVTYNKQEMYSTAFLFSKDGFVEKEKLFKSPVYKLQYLKQSIQEFIVAKINELIASNLFVEKIDEDMRIKILMTVIAMESGLLRLIEGFDYTKEIPKIILYSGGRDTLSEEDGILLAFFHLIGADIVIFTPTNYLNVELWIKPEYFTTHQLPAVQFDMNYRDKTMTAEAQGFWFKLKAWWKNLINGRQ